MTVLLKSAFARMVIMMMEEMNYASPAIIHGKIIYFDLILKSLTCSGGNFDNC